jgi:V-type H+-transporting ATPase subunit E
MLVKEVIEPARKSYTAMFGGDAPVLTLDTATFLPPPPSGDGSDDVESW